MGHAEHYCLTTDEAEAEATANVHTQNGAKVPLLPEGWGRRDVMKQSEVFSYLGVGDWTYFRNGRSRLSESASSILPSVLY